MKIIPIEYGKSVLPEAMVFENGRKDVSHEIVFKVYLIKTEDKLMQAAKLCPVL